MRFTEKDVTDTQLDPVKGACSLNSQDQQLISWQSLSQRPVQEAEEARIPQSEEASFPQSEEASFPQSEEARIPQSEEASFPQSEEASFPQSEEASFPQSEEASFPQSEEASFPQSEEASFPQSEEARIPQSEEASFPQSEEARIPQSEETNFPHPGSRISESVFLEFEAPIPESVLLQTVQPGSVAAYDLNPNFQRNSSRCEIDHCPSSLSAHPDFDNRPITEGYDHFQDENSCLIGNRQLERNMEDNTREDMTFNLQQRKALKRIDDELGKKDMQSLKFLCKDVIPHSSIEVISRGIDLMNELEARKMITEDNVWFLAELLFRIGRAGLVAKHLGIKTVQLRQEIESKGSQLPPFRVLLHEIIEDTTRREMETMKFVARIPRARQEDVTDGESLFLVLENELLLSYEDTSMLEDMLSQIDRNDLLHKVHLYNSSQGFDRINNGGSDRRQVMIEPSRTAGWGQVRGQQEPTPRVFDPPPPYTPHPVPHPRPITPQEQLQHNNSPPMPSQTGAGAVEAMIRRKPPGPVNGVSAYNGNHGNRERMETNLTQAEIDATCYKMDAKPRGKCVIINNKQFMKIEGDRSSRKLPNREGTDVDVGNLEYIFKKLHFEIDRFENLTHTEMVRTLMQYAITVDHSRYDCFVCCVLSHGEEGQVFGRDGKLIPIHDLLSPFKATCCPSLMGKPKIFFIQACQGKQKQQGAHFQTDAPDSMSSELPPDTIPNEADFLIGYATLPGFVSYRSKTYGSWYITKLVETLDKYAHRDDLLSILIRVNDEVSRAVAQIGDEEFKQSPAPVPTIRKKIFFR